MIALINPQAPKGRPDINHGCNPWTETTPANHGCNPCAVTHRAKTLLLLLLLAMTTAAQAQSIFGGGSGTYADPYIISTTDHLDQLAADVNGGNWYNGKFFSLQADLDYAGKTYTPIGRYPNGFGGEFFGNNHSINNVTVVGDGTNIGIFGCLMNQAKVQDLTLGGNSRLEGSGSVGGIAGYVENNKEICRCHVGADVNIAARDNPNSDIDSFGGIVGAANGDFTIRNCTSRATLTNSGIGRCTGMGGIIGTTMFGGTIEDCISFSPIDCGNDVGGIVGQIYSGTLTVQRCFYTNFFGGGIQGHDTDGALWIGTVSFGENVSGTLPYATCWDATTPYFGVGRNMVMTLNYSSEAGYVPFNVEYFANGSIPLTLEANGQYRFTMPNDNVTITGTVETFKRDIGYSDWVSITVPEQVYTGEPLTPVVTVIDNKDGAPVTLTEGVHYTVTLPDGGCVIPGYHNITITGMGDFGGQTTKTFTIFNPGSGTQGDPYIIRNTDEMDGLAASVNGGDSKSGKFFRLEADLDYTGKTYTRIGTSAGAPFSGTFDGNGHTISHVTLNENYKFIGLFGYSNGTVKNLTLDHSSIHAERSGSVGGIVGCCDGGDVTGCYVTENVSISATGKETEGWIEGGDDVGGIVGSAYYCAVSNCMNFAEVSGIERVGGVVGRNNNSTIINNYYAGNCTVGGIGVSGSNSGSDAASQAQRGYAIEVQHPLSISLIVSVQRIGVFYDGKVYAGNGQSVMVSFEIPNSSVTPQCYTLSAGTLVDIGNGTYFITMPAEDVFVSPSIVEQYGTYYVYDCFNGTATVIYDISYDTLEYAGIEDFEYMGSQYTVTAIADGAFDGLSNLEGINCHSNISSIGANAFRNCTGITYFGFYHTDTPPTLGEGVFEGLGLDTLWLMVPFCSQYEYSQHPVFGQFGTITGNGVCEYNFYNEAGDKQWSNPANWQDADFETCTEAPGAGARVAIFEDCEIGEDVTVGSVTIGNYIDEEWGYYERLTLKDGATLTATNFIYTTGDERNFIIEDGAQVVHTNAGAEATVKKAITAYSTQSGVNNGWHLIALPLTGSIDVDSVGNLIGGEYDLYAYDESTAYWTNRKTAGSDFAALEATKGYLYAHGEDVTLEFSGTLQNSSDTISVPLSYTEESPLSGFNLVGNPFPCEAYLDRAYYVLSANGTDINPDAIQGNVPIPPCTAVFVKAVEEGDSVVFTRVAP